MRRPITRFREERHRDIDTTAKSIAWAYECFEKGLISERDTGGLQLTWGNHRVLIALIEMIAKRQGLGTSSPTASKGRRALQRLSAF